MQAIKRNFLTTQRGVSLSGLIFVMAILAVLAVFAMKVFPTWMEYKASKDAIVAAKASGGTVLEMQQSFDKNADINRIESIAGKDLDFNKDGTETDISFAYEKRIPLAGNISLLIDYAATTARGGVAPVKSAVAQ